MDVHIYMDIQIRIYKYTVLEKTAPRFGVKNRIHVIHLIDFGLSKRYLVGRSGRTNDRYINSR